mmetsp:Transcript_9251/g.42077  ORF Transcript_9251/g.42077 Transcript_9251/m.42077 type:complete len:600 (-) Transcript_9251:92-1891(-)
MVPSIVARRSTRRSRLAIWSLRWQNCRTREVLVAPLGQERQPGSETSKAGVAQPRSPTGSRDSRPDPATADRIPRPSDSVARVSRAARSSRAAPRRSRRESRLLPPRARPAPISAVFGHDLGDETTVTMLGARSRMTSLMMFLVCITGFLPVATAYTYTFIMSVVSVSEGSSSGLGPVIRDIRLDGVRPTEDQFNINKMPDRDLCQGHDGATCDAGQIGMIDDDPNTDSNWFATNGAGQEFFSITSPTRVSTIEIASHNAFYTPGWIIEEDGVEVYRDVTNRGSDGSRRSFTYNLAQTATGVEYLQRAKLTADDGAAEDWFSRYVSIDGDKMVLGAPKDGGQGPGSAYVFTRVTAGDLASGWTQVAKLTAADGAEGDKFGNSVSIDGFTVVIGAYLDDANGTDSGSAYVFTLACPDGYRGARCETAMPCVASTNSSKDGGDGDFYCVNGGTIGGTTGSCTCTSCDTAYGGASCHIGPCDMEQSCYDFNVRNGMTTPATCAWMAFEAPGCDAKCGACGDCDYELTTGDIKGWGASEAGGSTGNVASARDCAKLCSENDDCLSYEYSRTSKICNRNTEADPTIKNNYRDYLFCSNKTASEA